MVPGLEYLHVRFMVRLVARAWDQIITRISGGRVGKRWKVVLVVILCRLLWYAFWR